MAAEEGASLELLLEQCAKLSDDDVLELQKRMAVLEAQRRDAVVLEKRKEEAAFKRDQKVRLRAMARGGGAKRRGGESDGSDEEGETAEEKAERLQQMENERRRAEAEQERLEMGDTGPKMTRAEQLEQQKLNQRKVKSGVRMMKTGPAKHKFDLEAHNARKNGGLYKTGKDWHEARNSKAAFQAKNAKSGVMCGKCNKRPCACRAKETDSRARQVEKEAKQQKKGITPLNDKNKKKKK